MRTALLLALLAAPLASAEEGQPATAEPGTRLYAGAKVGLVHVAGLTAVASRFEAGRQAWDLDLLWEPSAYLQSYSVGGAWHPLGGALYVGPRVRWLQFRAPWGRSFAAEDNHLGLSGEVGGRWLLGEGRKGMLSVSGGPTWVPTQAGTLQWMLGFSVGFAWGVAER
ncbi:MAG: hypothetical protein RL653_4514 [Pseudomonadota bacterium]|jgi:hypothetical protein